MSPGYGYRLLDKNEILRDGDEFWSADTGAWQETGYPGQRATYWAYRRKIDPGTGYVLVAEGSPVLEGDEFLSHERKWCRTGFAGVRDAGVIPNDVYRRKTVSVKPSEGVLTNWIAAQGEALVKARERIEELEACNIEAQHRLERLSKQLEKKTNELAQAQADKCDAEENASFYRKVNSALRDDLSAANSKVEEWKESYALAIARNEQLRDDNEGLRCHIEELRADVYRARTECGRRPRDTFFDL